MTRGSATDRTGKGLALGLFDTGLSPRLRAVLPRIDPADVAAIGPRDTGELAAAGVVFPCSEPGGKRVGWRKGAASGAAGRR
jgi:hypothetical protein